MSLKKKKSATADTLKKGSLDGARKSKFLKTMQSGYSFPGKSIVLGAAMFGDEALQEAHVSLPLKTLNRHGLIAGATGTGKTKTLQTIAGELSANGVPSVLMDIKGDLSGLAQPGTSDEKLAKRHEQIGLPFALRSYPVEFFTLSKEKGARLRATISEFGPVLMSKILDLNDTQAGILSVIFKFCDDKGLLLLDLKDLKKTLNFVTNEGKEAMEEEYGKISPASTGTILRKVVALEQQDGELFFGERSFDPEDLLRHDESGAGFVSIVRLMDIQNKPALFSTFMLQMLGEIYEKFPEEGDLEKPKLMIFIDEAHLIFNNASKLLLNQIETTIKLIRSKGVGVVFCTQIPDDVPAPILSQLGFKVQHALRAFTAKDRRTIKSVAENYPISEFYETDQLLTSMGIGEALITALDEKGRPTPLARTMLRAPQSRMGILKAAEIEAITSASPLVQKYNQKIDRRSAYEILSEQVEKLPAPTATKKKRGSKGEESTLNKIMSSSIAREVGRTAARELTRGILGVFGFSKRRK